MSGHDRKGLSEDYPQEYSSIQSIDAAYVDERIKDPIAPTSTEDLTERKKCMRVSRQISRTRSMDRYKPDRRSTRSSASAGGSRRSRRNNSTGARRSVSLRPADFRSGSLRPGDFLAVPENFRRHSSARMSIAGENLRRGSSLSGVIERKERRRRRIVLVIMLSFIVLVLSSILVVVVTLTHSSVISDHNTTSKYYTFAPHHPLS